MHKANSPLRPIVSMPDSAYEPVSKVLADWIGGLPQARINCHVAGVKDSLCNLKLNSDEKLVSLDVVSLFTNVPVQETILLCADFLNSGDFAQPPLV